MRRVRRRKKINIKKSRLLLFAVLLLLISGGYAALRLTLDISGVTGIANASWDIHFANVEVLEKSDTVAAKTPIVTGESKTRIEYDVDLNKRGDVFEFKADIENTGSIDGIIDTITSSFQEGTDSPTTTVPSYLNYSVKYLNGSKFVNNHAILSGEKETIKVRIELKDSLTDQEFEAIKGKTIKLGLETELTQKDLKEIDADNFEVRLNAKGGTLAQESINVDKGETIGTLPTPENEGFYLEGWYLDEDYETPVDENFIPTSNVEIFAKWKKSVELIDLITQNLRLNQDGPKPIQIDNANEIEEEFDFSSEDDEIATVDSEGNVTPIAEGETDVIITGRTTGKTVTVHVIVEYDRYVITLNANGGEVDPSSITVIAGDNIGTLPEPVNNGDMIFDGWYTSLRYVERVSSSYTPSRNKEIYAKWKTNSISCTYDGELVEGAEFSDDFYTYRYQEEMTSNGWESIGEDGWGVVLKDKNSNNPVTGPMCSEINDKPVVSMSYMFEGAKTTSFNTTGFDTSNVTNMNSMFKDSAFIGLDLSTFDTSNVTDMSNMFKGSSIESIDISNFNTINVTTMENMFSGCSDLLDANLNGLSELNLSNVYNMFNGADNLTYLDLTGFNVLNPDGSESLFSGNNKNLEIIADNWVFNQNPIDSYEFHYAELSTFSYFDVQYRLKGATKLSAKNWVLPHEVRGFFSPNSMNSHEQYSTLEEIDVSGWDLSSTDDLSFLFEDCSNLTTIIGLETWDTSHITNMSFMFSNDIALTTLDVSSFNTSNVTDMNFMFNRCSSLETLDLTGFDSNKVSSATYIFNNCSKLQKIYTTSLFDLTGLEYEYDEYLYFDNSEISNIYSGDYKAAEEFNGCSSLVGGNGTTYSATRVSNEYAKLDGGNSNKGYFSSRSTIKVVFNANGGDVSPSKVYINPGSSVGTLPEPTKVGSQFDGWYTGISSGEPVDENYQPTGDATIYARWTDDIRYTVTFDANGGNLVQQNKQVDANAKIGNLPTPTKTGKLFSGWYTGLQDGIKVTANYKVTGNMTIHARWVKSIEGLSLPASKNVVVGETETINLGDTSEYEEYSFSSSDSSLATVNSNGVVTGKNFGIVNILIKGKVSKQTRIVTFYVIESNTDSYTLSFDANGGTVSESSRTVYQGLAVGDLPIPTKENYSFGGWKDSNNNYYTSNNKPTKSETLTAEWVEGAKCARIDSTYFETVQAAVSAAATNDTIVLLKDVTESPTINKEITLDLDGHTLTGQTTLEGNSDISIINGKIVNSGKVIYKQGDLTLGSTDSTSDNGVDVINTSTDTSTTSIDLYGSNTVTINSGRIVTNSGKTGTGLRVPFSQVTINGGTIEARIGVMADGTTSHVVMNGGTINAEDTGIEIPGTSSTITMNGGTINSNWGIYATRGSMTVNDGTINATERGAYSSFGTVAFKGGTINSDYIGIDSDTITMSAGTINAKYAGLNVGTNSLSLSGGTINSEKNGINSNAGYNQLYFTGGEINSGAIGINSFGTNPLTVQNLTINAVTQGIEHNSDVTLGTGTEINVVSTGVFDGETIGVDIGNYGSLIMNNATIYVEGTGNVIGAKIPRERIMEMNSGSITAKSLSGEAIGVNNEGELSIYGGIIQAIANKTSYGVLGSNSNSQIQLDGGTIISESSTETAYVLHLWNVYFNNGILKAKGPSRVGIFLGNNNNFNISYPDEMSLHSSNQGGYTVYTVY